MATVLASQNEHPRETAQDTMTKRNKTNGNRTVAAGAVMKTTTGKGGVSQAQRNASPLVHVAFLNRKAKEALTSSLSLQSRTTGHFGLAVSELLQNLGCQQKQLAEMAQVNPSQLSSWLRPPQAEVDERNASGKERVKREIGPNEVCRIAWALARLIDGEERGPGVGHLDVILNSLLSLAGYSSQFSLQDVVWREKIAESTRSGPEGSEDTPENTPAKARSARALRVGWFEWLPYMKMSAQGFSRELAEGLCSVFFQGKTEFLHVPLTEMSRALQLREIDIAAPIMTRVPRRLSWLRFSNKIPGMSCGFDAVFAKKRAADILLPGALEEITTRQETLCSRHLNLDRMRPIVAQGESSEMVLKLVTDIKPDPIEPRGPTGHALDLIEGLLERSEKGRAELLFTLDSNCKSALDRVPGELQTLSQLLGNENQDFLGSARLDFAFGVHPEEPQLLLAINESIQLLARIGYFQKLFKKHNLEYHNPEMKEETP